MMMMMMMHCILFSTMHYAAFLNIKLHSIFIRPFCKSNQIYFYYLSLFKRIHPVHHLSIIRKYTDVRFYSILYIIDVYKEQSRAHYTSFWYPAVDVNPI